MNAELGFFLYVLVFVGLLGVLVRTSSKFQKAVVRAAKYNKIQNQRRANSERRFRRRAEKEYARLSNPPRYRALFDEHAERVFGKMHVANELPQFGAQKIKVEPIPERIRQTQIRQLGTLDDLIKKLKDGT